VKAKAFKTLDEQVEILKNKGMIVDDYDFAKSVLLRENYFFLNGYRGLFFKSPNDRMFIPGTSFRELYAVFTFDRLIRNIFFKNILIIENNIKSIFSYHLSKKYGIREKNYLNPNNFNNDSSKSRQINDLLKKMKRQIRVNGSQHSATMHYLTNYGYIPLWIVVKVLSFGIVSELYSILKVDDQKDIAAIYDIESEELIIYLLVLANYRNKCAHEDILFDHRTQREITDTKFHHFLNIPLMDGEYIYGKDDIFSLVIIMKEMLLEDEFNLLIAEIRYEIDKLSGKLSTIEIGKVLDSMGFPMNYYDLARME